MIIILFSDMSVYHDEIEIEDFDYDEETETYYYPCPCGDRFLITKEELAAGEDTATCPSCSLIVKVIYDVVSFLKEIVSAHVFINLKTIRETAWRTVMRSFQLSLSLLHTS